MTYTPEIGTARVPLVEPEDMLDDGEVPSGFFAVFNPRDESLFPTIYQNRDLAASVARKLNDIDEGAEWGTIPYKGHVMESFDEKPTRRPYLDWDAYLDH
ncbi:MAG: hypothetical protein DRI30_07360 [Chloroflexi bacterium]|nr:MAG: hypothetical protein DRI30_07360 [Chloroflexota bacterium]